MASEPIIRTTGNNRLKLCYSEYLAHYQLLAFALIPPFFVFFLLLVQVSAHSTMILNDVSVTWMLLSSAMLFIFLFIVLHNKLKLTTINTTKKPEMLKMQIETLAKKRGWYIKCYERDTMIITSYLHICLGMRAVIAEQQIIILFKENKILINSRTNNNDPNIPFSFGQNHKNVRLIKNICWVQNDQI